MLYRVDYLIQKDKVDASLRLPKYVLAEDFDGAVKAARKYESEGVALYECAVEKNDGYVAIARGFKGLGASSTEDAPVATQ